jgi:uncharacterized protein YnzC (UPF0291/DUF896 family)
LKTLLLEIIRKKAEVYCNRSTTENSTTLPQPNELISITNELNRLNGFKKGLYESLVTGNISDADYRILKQSYETKIDALTERELELREITRTQHLQQIVKSKTDKQFEAVKQINDLTATAIEALIEKILVFEDKHIEVQFKFTDEISEGRADK